MDRFGRVEHGRILGPAGPLKARRLVFVELQSDLLTRTHLDGLAVVSFRQHAGRFASASLGSTGKKRQDRPGAYPTAEYGGRDQSHLARPAV